MSVDVGLVELLEESFEGGEINRKKYKDLADIESRIKANTRKIQDTITRVIKDLSKSNPSSSSSSKGVGSGVTIVNGRTCVSVNPTTMRSIGVVHGRSKTGLTVYVEPYEVVELGNLGRELGVKREREIGRIFTTLTRKVLDGRDEIERNVEAMSQVDSARGRWRYMERENGCIPEVRDEGVVSVRDCRHPLIKGAKGNHLKVGEGNKGLVLTGPNAGGKTVVMKTFALLALCARDGIPVLGEAGGRVDWFDGVAGDVGDQQSIERGESTYEGSLRRQAEALGRAGGGGSWMVVLDEVGGGTNPRQGEAIGRAVLEDIASNEGARIVATTHFEMVKDLAVKDERFRVGRMEFGADGPTFRLLEGVGESYAIKVAERVGLGERVVRRAEDLMGVEGRRIGEVLEELEKERIKAVEGGNELRDKVREAEKEKERLGAERAELARVKRNAREKVAKEFRRELEEKEKILEGIMEDMKKMTEGGKRNGVKVVGNTWRELRVMKRDVGPERGVVGAGVGRAVGETREVQPLKDTEEVSMGEALFALKGAFAGRTGTVVKDNGKNVELQFGGISTRMSKGQLGRAESGGGEGGGDDGGTRVKEGRKQGISKRVEEDLRSAGDSGLLDMRSGKRKDGTMMRMDSNTCDVRGLDVEDGIQKCRDMFSTQMRAGRGTVFILHGHGSKGVLKRKIRDALRSEGVVKKFNKAKDEDGGDAFTEVTLKDGII